MRRDYQRLNDIPAALDWIAKVIAGRTEADFLADIVGLRNILVHEYFGGRPRFARTGLARGESPV
jgi:uncharacterized protein with HEPN domain